MEDHIFGKWLSKRMNVKTQVIERYFKWRDNNFVDNRWKKCKVNTIKTMCI